MTRGTDQKRKKVPSSAERDQGAGSKKFKQGTTNPLKHIQQYVGKRVAKVFPLWPDRLFFGNVAEALPATNHSNTQYYFVVKYDDGDQEDLDEQELKKAIQICQENLADSIYVLWDIYNIDPKVIRLQSKRIPESIRQCSENVIKFFLFMAERQRCWERRCYSENSMEWTNSNVLRNFYFCNVYRELDRGTSYFHSQILNRWDKFGPNISQAKWIEIVLWASYCYRLVNRVESFMDCTGKLPKGETPSLTSRFNGIPALEEWPVFRGLVIKCQKGDGRARVSKFFTGAHQTCNFSDYVHWMNEAHASEGIHLKLVALEVHHAAKLGDIEGCHQVIAERLKGCGDFMAWQITCDLLESKCLPKCESNNFCVLGKGAKGILPISGEYSYSFTYFPLSCNSTISLLKLLAAGIEEIFFQGRSSHRCDYMQYVKQLVGSQDLVFEELSSNGMHLNFPRWRNKPLTAKEIEHALCEFSKFQRIERNLAAGKNYTGQRLRKTRSSFDNDKNCLLCNLDEEQLFFCDTCNEAYCSQCDSSLEDSSSLAWICLRCKNLEKLTWD